MEIRNQTPLKMPKIIGRKPNYTQEYMMMVGKQVTEGGMTLREAAKTFGMSHGSVSVCKARFKKGDWGHCNAAKVKQANERTQIQRLESSLREVKHELAELFLENLMLKKALQFSQQIKKENSSVITSENLDQLLKGAK